MSGCIIFTDQHDPKGRTIRFNLDMSTSEAASRMHIALLDGEMLEIPNENGGEPYFVNPDRVASIKPREDS